MMISNLQSARALIQADLDHARKVLEMWSQQVSDLERALAQIDAVGESRKALKEQYTVGRNSAPRLAPPAASNPTRGGRKPKTEAESAGTTKKQRAKSSGRSSDSVASPAGAGKTARIKKKAAVSAKAQKAEAKYRDPNSDKTWSGRGRRPAWFVGEPEQYRIDHAALGHEASTASSAVH